MLRSRVARLLVRVARVLAIAMVGAVAAALVAAVMYLDNKDDLSVWHTVHLDEEFTDTTPITTLGEYLALEDRLFAQLRREVYDRFEPSQNTDFDRYASGSRSDPENWPRNWNRTFELAAADAAYGVVLLHGYSDGPYSLRSIGDELHSRGAHVLGLRLPGHGTAPSGLVHTQYEDMVAAVRLAMAAMDARMGGKPIFIIGYSNGAALALEHAIASVNAPDLVRPAGLILLSPEIAVSPLAAAAIWQARIGRLLGLDKLAWTDVLPEIEPYKYGSFAVNAGTQVRRITLANQAGLSNLAEAGKLGDMPPILAFQSAVDATVRAPAVVNQLFDRLAPGGHHLVVFDVNRLFVAQGLLSVNFDVGALLEGEARPYDVTLVTNKSPASNQVVLKTRAAGDNTIVLSEPGLSWPASTYSLTHVALPFSRQDPVYGNDPPAAYTGVRLGIVTPRGERGVLKISASTFTRLRWNPFHSAVVRKLSDFIDALAGPAA